MLWALVGVALVTGLYHLWRSWMNLYNYWDRRGIPSKKPVPIFGNVWSAFYERKGLNRVHTDYYELFPDVPFYGFTNFMRPMLVVRDVDQVERVVIKDFHHFSDRGFRHIGEMNNSINVNLFNMSGKKWRAMRNKFSPMFTTGKLRHMIPQMKELNDAFVKTLDECRQDVDMQNVFQRLAMDVIASCAFGISINVDGGNEFREMGKRIFKLSPSQIIRVFLHTSLPSVAKALQLPLFHPEVIKYFTGIIRRTLAFRKESKQTRNDFVQMMVTLQEKGDIEFEGDQSDNYLLMDKSEKKLEHYELTDDVMVGQAFVFLIAGFEAMASTMMYLCYEFSTNPEIQLKARQEVKKTVQSHDGVLDYDSLKEMTYLDQCIKEVMRLHSFVPILVRECTKDYTFPGTDVSVKAGDGLLIPVAGIHQDPKHYPEPQKFMPERFAPDVTRPNCSYMPFGDGPRMCIAMRFALANVKTSIARILLDSELTLSSKTKLPLELDTSTFGNSIKNPLYFNFTKTNL